MSTEDLRRLIEKASKGVEPIFRKDEFVAPLWHAIRTDQQHVVFPLSRLSKEEGFTLMRTACESGDILRYVFICEAWIVRASTPADRQQLQAYLGAGGMARDHQNREEFVMFNGEDIDIGHIIGRRAIVRKPGRKPELGPLILEEMTGGAVAGRGVGMLVRRTKPQ